MSILPPTMMNPQKPEKRPINGILLLDKPIGLSSNGALQKVKRLFNAQKAGHTGTLDPLATGMLPVCFGEATKICQYLLDADKAYRAVGLLGQKTSTGDTAGEIIHQTEHFCINEEQLKKAINTLTGEITQIPPMFSALKHQGKPLYQFARNGVTLERQARPVTTHSIDLQHFDGRYFDLIVTCSKGTYIRTLIEDIGEQLGVGAHVTQLHRLHTMGFQQEKLMSLEALEAMDDASRLACLIPMEQAIPHIPVLSITEEEVSCLRQGKQISAPHCQIEGCVRLHSPQEGFIGLGDVQQELLSVRRLLRFDKA